MLCWLLGICIFSSFEPFSGFLTKHRKYDSSKKKIKFSFTNTMKENWWKKKVYFDSGSCENFILKIHQTIYLSIHIYMYINNKSTNFIIEIYLTFLESMNEKEKKRKKAETAKIFPVSWRVLESFSRLFLTLFFLQYIENIWSCSSHCFLFKKVIFL